MQAGSTSLTEICLGKSKLTEFTVTHVKNMQSRSESESETGLLPGRLTRGI